MDIYTVQVLDDYHHLTKVHDGDLEDIMEYAETSMNLESCDLSHCDYSDRRYRVNQNASNPLSLTKIEDRNLRFYIDVMDSLHFHFYHLYTTGLRISNKNIDTTEQKTDDEYFDPQLFRYREIMSNKRAETARFNRLNDPKSSKCNIKSDTQYHADNGTSTTALDCIYHQLQNDPYCIAPDYIMNLHKYVEIQQFDTESMQNDVDLNGTNGFIASAPAKCMDALIQIFTLSQGMFVYRPGCVCCVYAQSLCLIHYAVCASLVSPCSVTAGSFSVGLQFDYDIADKPKGTYDNFKTEIMNYQHLPQKLINKDVLGKVNQLVKTKRARSTRQIPNTNDIKSFNGCSSLYGLH